MRRRTCLLTVVALAVLFTMSAVAQSAPGSFEMARAGATPGNPDRFEPLPQAGGSPSCPTPSRRESPADMLSRITEKSAAFSTFLTAVSKAELQKLLKSEGPFTLFLPTNEAFAKMPPEVLEGILNNPEKCREFLLAHLVRGKVTTDDLRSAGAVTTAQGTTLAVSASEEGIKVENARVIFRDIPAKNGVIQVVDAVLTPGIQVALK
jgi:uncharacterized surface protein with fasciclin (FAS1) repeats